MGLDAQRRPFSVALAVLAEDVSESFADAVDADLPSDRQTSL
jgi:hypothetical protein